MLSLLTIQKKSPLMMIKNTTSMIDYFSQLMNSDEIMVRLSNRHCKCCPESAVK